MPNITDSRVRTIDKGRKGLTTHFPRVSRSTWSEYVTNLMSSIKRIEDTSSAYSRANSLHPVLFFRQRASQPTAAVKIQECTVPETDTLLGIKCRFASKFFENEIGHFA
ncbi:hypothetical protein CEXT_82561 [Caerostris extrusa]|uniref:Uncharacterized protein n=1 Tax=Caerostris extrusa TaxID=172846 RepID=A0AAV4M2Q2_CAEEX|nr:hypothetical protein CEXT_82561 [Caerostris extrusa]